MSITHRENMILYNVLNQEVIFEEYFCNLLRIDDFRQLFLDFINEKNTILSEETIQYNHFNTEVILDNKNGRADLFLNINDTKKYIFEIKNKDYTSLTSNQPQSYLNYLKDAHEKGLDFNKHLFFLIPKNYQHQNELLKRWQKFDGIYNQIFYWQDLIFKIKEKKLEQENIEIKIFYEFCEYWFNMKPIDFSEDETKLFKTEGYSVRDFKNLSVPKLMQKLESVVRNIGSNVGMQEDKSSLGFYYSMKLQNHKNGYEDFELELSGIELEKFANNETSADEQYFGYIVNITDVLGSDSYQKTVIDTIHEIKKQLEQTRHKAVQFISYTSSKLIVQAKYENFIKSRINRRVK